MDATYSDPALPYLIGTIQSDIQTTQKKGRHSSGHP